MSEQNIQDQEIVPSGLSSIGLYLILSGVIMIVLDFLVGLIGNLNTGFTGSPSAEVAMSTSILWFILGIVAIATGSVLTHGAKWAWFSAIGVCLAELLLFAWNLNSVVAIFLLLVLAVINISVIANLFKKSTKEKFHING